MKTLLLSAAVILAVSASNGDTITLQPGAEGVDTYVYELFPDTPLGSFFLLAVGLDNTSQGNHTLIKWDISAIPAGSTINDATMALHCYAITGAPSGQVSYYIIIEPWDEATATWNTKPLYSTSVQTSSNWPTTGAWMSSNVTEFVQDWYDGTFTNYGIYVAYTGTSGECWARFDSSDGSTGSDRPKLIITYAPLIGVEGTSLGRIKNVFR
jgi:hypothetical protein